MKILLATDGSPHAQAAVEMAKTLPLPREEVSITVLSVACVEKLTIHRHQRRLDDIQRLFEEAKAEQTRAAARHVETAAEQLRQADWQVKVLVRFGHPVDQILQAISDVQADLLMVGSRGLGAFSGWLTGSVSQTVVSLAPCSVWVIKTAPDTQSSHRFRLLLATDGSNGAVAASAALQWFHFGERREVAVVTVLPRRLSLNRAARQAAWALVGDVAERLRPFFGQVTTFVRQGAPARQIIETVQKWNAHLVVVGSRGLSPVQALLQGSVSQKVATHAPCSVLVIKGEQALNVRQPCGVTAGESATETCSPAVAITDDGSSQQRKLETESIAPIKAIDHRCQSTAAAHGHPRRSGGTDRGFCSMDQPEISDASEQAGRFVIRKER